MTTGRGTAAERVVRSATCLGCGCACDDIDVVVRDGLIVRYEDYMDPIALARLLGRTGDLAAALSAT